MKLTHSIVCKEEIIPLIIYEQLINAAVIDIIKHLMVDLRMFFSIDDELKYLFFNLKRVFHALEKVIGEMNDLIDMFFTCRRSMQCMEIRRHMFSSYKKRYILERRCSTSN